MFSVSQSQVTLQYHVIDVNQWLIFYACSMPLRKFIHVYYAGTNLDFFSYMQEQTYIFFSYTAKNLDFISYAVTNLDFSSYAGTNLDFFSYMQEQTYIFFSYTAKN